MEKVSSIPLLSKITRCRCLAIGHTHYIRGEAKNRASTLAPSISLSLRGQTSASLTLIHSHSFIATCIHTRSWVRAFSLYFYDCLDTSIVKLEFFFLKYAGLPNRICLYCSTVIANFEVKYITMINRTTRLIEIVIRNSNFTIYLFDWNWF